MQVSWQSTRVRISWLTTSVGCVIVLVDLPLPASRRMVARCRETDSELVLANTRRESTTSPDACRQRRGRGGRDAGRASTSRSQARHLSRREPTRHMAPSCDCERGTAHWAKRATRLKHETGDVDDNLPAADLPNGLVKRWNVAPTSRFSRRSRRVDRSGHPSVAEPVPGRLRAGRCGKSAERRHHEHAGPEHAGRSSSAASRPASHARRGRAAF